VPEAELVEVDKLRVDSQNPNRQSKRQFRALKESIKRYGFVVPIITNRDLLVADGEHRLQAAKELGMKAVSVIRLPVSEVDRRMLRQILNKLRGEHNRELDAAEYVRIIEQGEKDYLNALLVAVGEKPPKELLEREFSVIVPATYEIIVECKDEADQKRIFEKLKLEGYKLRILTL
jgi:ParB-like chromosome segregation protein Spo0J